MVRVVNTTIFLLVYVIIICQIVTAKGTVSPKPVSKSNGHLPKFKKEVGSVTRKTKDVKGLNPWSSPSQQKPWNSAQPGSTWRDTKLATPRAVSPATSTSKQPISNFNNAQKPTPMWIQKERPILKRLLETIPNYAWKIYWRCVKGLTDLKYPEPFLFDISVFDIMKTCLFYMKPAEAERVLLKPRLTLEMAVDVMHGKYDYLNKKQSVSDYD